MDSGRPSDKICAILLEKMFTSGAPWHSRGLRRAAREAGLSEEDMALAVPNGVTDLILYLSRRGDSETEAIIMAANLRTMGVRERIGFAVRTRIEVHADQREAIRKALLGAAAPWRALTAPRTLWATSDMIWHAIGDSSTDANWYSKRVILSGVLAATILPWLRGDDESAWMRLDQALEQVMFIEKCKARVRDPIAQLSRLIFGASDPWPHAEQARRS